MKALAVCGFGVGSSMILKMSLEKAFRELGISAEVENTDINDARGAGADVIFTSFELAEELRSSVNVPVYSVKRYMDVAEVKAAVEKYISER